MKILLQQKSTGLYLKAPDVWVAHGADAYDFPSSTHAIRFQQRHHLEDVRMVFRFDREGYSIRVPIDAQVSCAA